MPLILLFVLWFSSVAFAHDAPTGWAYPFACCSHQDCRPAKPEEIRETKAGYLVISTGEVVGYKDTRIRDSPDDQYHLCQQNGDFDKGRVLCLFRPPQSF